MRYMCFWLRSLFVCLKNACNLLFYSNFKREHTPHHTSKMYAIRNKFIRAMWKLDAFSAFGCVEHVSTISKKLLLTPHSSFSTIFGYIRLGIDKTHRSRRRGENIEKNAAVFNSSLLLLLLLSVSHFNVLSTNVVLRLPHMNYSKRTFSNKCFSLWCSFSPFRDEMYENFEFIWKKNIAV